jgi:hypothetical protein
MPRARGIGCLPLGQGTAGLWDDGCEWGGVLNSRDNRTRNKSDAKDDAKTWDQDGYMHRLRERRGRTDGGGGERRGEGEKERASPARTKERQIGEGQWEGFSLWSLI